MGARVVHVAERGYGNALKAGIRVARGTFVVMADADDSYDLLELPKFVGRLREGYDLAQGCRLPAGGGTIAPGAMPPLHRWWGNPMFSAMVRSMFWAPDSRRLLRHARIQERPLRPARPAQPGDGVRDGDGNQVEPDEGQDCRGADHAPSRRP